LGRLCAMPQLGRLYAAPLAGPGMCRLRLDSCWAGLSCAPGSCMGCTRQAHEGRCAQEPVAQAAPLAIPIYQSVVAVCCCFFDLVWLAFLPPFFHLVCIGEALPADTLHHKHHAVMLLMTSTSPPHLAGPRMRSRRCAIHVHRLEAPPFVALGSDRIAWRRR
jgi:hypothetical protein